MAGRTKSKNTTLKKLTSKKVLLKTSTLKPIRNGKINSSQNFAKLENTITNSRKRKAVITNGDDNPNEKRYSKRTRVPSILLQQSTDKLPIKISTKPKKIKSKKKPILNVPMTLTISLKKPLLSKAKLKIRNVTGKKLTDQVNIKQGGLLKKKKVASRTKLKESKTKSKKVAHKKIASLPKKKKSLERVTVDGTNNVAVPLKKKKSSKKGLEPKNYVTEYVKDPTFETKEFIPHVSTLAHSRLLIRAINLNDMKLLKNLINDKNSICSFTVPRSLNIKRDAFSYALEKQNLDAIKILSDSKLAENLASFPDVILSDEVTGHNSFMMFGHALRNVCVGRGGKEGNNALLKDRSSYQSYQTSVNFITFDLAKEALAFGFPKPFIQKLSEVFPGVNSNVYNNFFDAVVYAIRAGHNQLAGQIIEEALTRGGYGFNLLHKEVLLNTVEPLTSFKSVSVLKKCISNDRITPLHCAAINPNTAYLTALLNSRPDYSFADMQNWSVIHYASVCTGTGPLEILVSRGVSTHQTTKDGDTSLHLASALGRIENVKLLLKNEKESEDEGVDDIPKDASGLLINLANKVGQTALHKAAAAGHSAVTQILLNGGADPAKFTPARYDKLTPFMLAAQHGHVEVLKVFMQHGAKVDAVDHKGRTALAHAVINGQGHVVSFLLRIGANNLKKDTSGNTLVHYAAAYGWYFCLKLLLEAGCPPNEPNDWKMTPLAISFMKGHMGLVEYILQQPGVDINSRVNDSTGVTLLLQTVASRPTKEFYSRLKFLLLNQKADCNITDFEGNNSFHYLVQTEHRQYEDDENYDNSETQKIVFDAIKLLWKHKCDPCALNSKKESPVSLAVHYGCFSMLNKLFDMSCRLPNDADAKENTLLHAMVNQAHNNQATAICKRWAKDPIKLEMLKIMASTYNAHGYTPLLWVLNRNGIVHKDHFVKNIIDFINFLIKILDSDVAAFDRAKKSGQSVLHLATQVNYAEEVLETILKMNLSLEVLNFSSMTPLTLAIVSGKEMAAKALINAGANINFKMEKMNSLLLLHALSQKKSFHLIPIMIDKGANVHEINPHTQNSILHYVCRKPNLPFAIESVRKLLQTNINIDAVNKDGRTPLHLAVNFRAGETDSSYDVEDALIEAKAKLNIRDIRGRIPLHKAFVKIGKHTDNSFMDPIELVTTLVRAMKKSLPDFGDEIKLADEFGCTPLHYAAVRGATISCSYLLMEMNDRVDFLNRNGNTAFGLAVLNGHEGCALQFQQKGANFLQNLNTNLSTPVEDKDLQWHWGLVRLKKEESDRKKLEKENYPILQEVVRKDWQGILHLMLEKLNNSGIGASLSIAAAINSNRLKLTRKLVHRAGPSELTVNEDQESLLHILAKNESKCEDNRDLIEKIVELLLSKGVDYSALDKNQSTAFILAAVERNFILCNLLGQNAVNNETILTYADKYGRTPFTALFWKINRKTEFSTELQTLAESLLSQKDLIGNTKCQYPIIVDPYPGVSYLNCETEAFFSCAKYTPLMMAVIVGNYSIVKWLLTIQNGNSINVNSQDDDGRTALMHAVRLNNIKMVRLILHPTTYDHTKDTHPWKINRLLYNKKNLIIDLKDNNGWTAMDHVAAVHKGDYYYASSDAIVRVLYAAGAKITQKSGDGISPIERVIKEKRPHLVECMEELLVLPKGKRKKFSVDHKELFDINIDGNQSYGKIITNYSTDCQLMNESLMDIEEEDCDLNLVEPDDLVSKDSNEKLKVILDIEQKVHFSCCLTKVDISYGTFGIYNFYKMQLLKQERGKELIFLFTRWGRVGDDGQFQKTPFASEEEAIKEFKKIFRSKTGNAWDSLDTFAAIPKKYRLVDLMTKIVKKSNQVKIDFEKFQKLNTLKSTNLPLPLVKLMKSVTMAHKTDVKFSGFDEEYENELPFGRLTFNALKKGADLLDQIGELIKKRDELNSQTLFSTTNEINFMESVLKPCEEFYGLIPVYGFSKEKLKPMFTMDDLREKQRVIHKLIHLEFASQLLIASQYNLENVNPFEYIYRCLNTKLEALVEEEEEAQLILQYIHNTSTYPECNLNLPKIRHIYRIERAGEIERMDKSGVENKHLLWHGTSTVNVLSILHRGLKVTPLEANLSGHLFGKGIYFADMFMKSQKYAHGSNSKYIFLCEVALGKIHPVKLNYWDVNSNKPLPNTCQSLKTVDSKWEPDPGSTIIWKGRTVPLGCAIENNLAEDENHGMDHNEFVVFREDQVKLRYLIQYQDI